MKKSDLKVGYVVKLRKGSFCMVLPTTTRLCVSGPEDWLDRATFTDDLRCVSPLGNRYEGHDVVEVYGLSRFVNDASKFGPIYRELLWKREEKPAAKKMTVKEICDALGYDVEIVKDGADE